MKTHPLPLGKPLAVFLTLTAAIGGCYRDTDVAKIICTTEGHCPKGYYCAVPGTKGGCRPLGGLDSGAVADVVADRPISPDAFIQMDGAPDHPIIVNPGLADAKVHTDGLSLPIDLAQGAVPTETPDAPVAPPDVLGVASNPDLATAEASLDLGDPRVADALADTSDLARPADALSPSPLDVAPDVLTIPDTATDTGTGTIGANPAGHACSTTQECQAGLTCLDGVCCTQPSCPQCQNCGAGGTCSITISSAEDITGTTCAGASTCNLAGLCKKKNGESCTPTGGECASGTCTDNRCCSQTCGVCQACTGAGGTCVAVLNTEDPDSCSGASTCNSAGSCKKKDGRPCGDPTECLSATCNSHRLCGPFVRCAGIAATCGPAGTGDCCVTLQVPGGTYYRGHNSVDATSEDFPATVGSFYLDKYEVTVERYRQFVDAGMGTQVNPPAAGEGAHPLIAGSGWNSLWNNHLAANTAELKESMKCTSPQTKTWTDEPGANENLPINCLTWYAAFAFCAWDMGRLPTEAEWNYAAAGGSEQRYYPWSSPSTSTVIDSTFAVYGSLTAPQRVGTKSPKGDGRWGQSDLAGNLWEWTLDWFGLLYPMPCINCADMSVASDVVIRGGDFGNRASFQQTNGRMSHSPDTGDGIVGVRCARSGP